MTSVRGAAEMLLCAAFFTGVAFAGASFAAAPAPQRDSRQGHLILAMAAAGDDFKGLLSLCNARQGSGAPQSQNSNVDATKVFDNLYFVGLPSVSAWALTTSGGIIVLDALNNPSEAETYIEGGLRKLGLDPAEIKYVVVTHAHGDHYGGAQYLADKFHARLVMSDTDWKVLEGPPRSNAPANWGPLPKRDIAVKDGGNLTLGDTTIEFYETPPHTPGTLSVIMPLRDGATWHTGGEWGGTAFNFARTTQNFITYASSAERFAGIIRDKGVDVPLSNHSVYDNSLEKISALKVRKDGEPHPFVTGADSARRFLTVAAECAKAMRLGAAETPR